MASLPILFTLLVQSSVIFAQIDEDTEKTNRDILQKPIELQDDVIKTPETAKTDFMDILMTPQSILNPTSSVAMMAQTFNTEKAPDEQVEAIKEIANAIAATMQNEMVNLLTYALSTSDKEDGNRLKKKRSIESPMDSTQLVMRLLKHIKSNNEQQNMAIEKMMTAEEIAHKFGIEFNPDPEILSELAMVSNKQANELTSILKDTYGTNNSTEENLEFVSLDKKKEQPDSAYYLYATESSKKEASIPKTLPHYTQHQHHNVQRTMNHPHYPEHQSHNNHYYNTYETQVMPPPSQHYTSPPVSQRPTFYETVAPQDYYPPYCSMEPITTTTTIVLPFEEEVQPQPEIVGEEYEESMSSKVIVENGEEPGSATVNHVTSYTISEKAHFKTPEIEKLPRQMQYYFFMM